MSTEDNVTYVGLLYRETVIKIPVRFLAVLTSNGHRRLFLVLTSKFNYSTSSMHMAHFGMLTVPHYLTVTCYYIRLGQSLIDYSLQVVYFNGVSMKNLHSRPILPNSFWTDYLILYLLKLKLHFQCCLVTQFHPVRQCNYM